MSVPRAEEVRFTDMCTARGRCTPASASSTTRPTALDVQGQFTVSLGELREAHTRTLPAVFGELEALTGMPHRRRIPIAAGTAAVLAWRHDPDLVDRETTATAVRFSLEELALRAPVAASRCGSRRSARSSASRGRPTPVARHRMSIETDASTWLGLVVGELGWDEAWHAGTLRVSGHRADLAPYLPLV